MVKSEQSPILAFQEWAIRWVVDNGRKLTQTEYGIAYAAFIAAHPGKGPVSKTMRHRLMLERLQQEMELRDKVSAMTDRELIGSLIKEVWALHPLWERPSVLIDEAITRLKKADTKHRWNERKTRRRAHLKLLTNNIGKKDK